jgi:hypothetical protein
VILSSYRIAELISIDTGPFRIFKRFREFVGRVSSRNMALRELAELVSCPFCIGVWISAVLSLLFFFPSIAGDIFLVVLAIAGGQAFLESMGRRFDQ